MSGSVKAMLLLGAAAVPASSAESDGAPSLLFIIFFVGGGLALSYLLFSLSSPRARRPTSLEVSRAAYQESLARLKQDPTSADLRQEALRLGREYSALTRKNAGVTIYDEMALSNDINAACAAAAAPRGSGESLRQRLENLKELRQSAVISEQEYQEKRAAILAEL